MITRIVKLTIQEHQIDEFLTMFSKNGPLIRQSKGCEGVKLVRDTYRPYIFFTISKWKTEADLERYRRSKLFKDTWQFTRSLFMLPAKAWTTNELDI